MRGFLMDWLVEVAEEYKLVSDTLYLTVSYAESLRYKLLGGLAVCRGPIFHGYCMESHTL
ncbi:hypothetical protein YC2023_075359 [Brassica napus]